MSRLQMFDPPKRLPASVAFEQRAGLGASPIVQRLEVGPETLETLDAILRNRQATVLDALDLRVMSALAGLPTFRVRAEIREIGLTDVVEKGSPVRRDACDERCVAAARAGISQPSLPFENRRRALGHAVHGWGCMILGQPERAERSLRRAISLDRNLPGPNTQRGFIRVLDGRPEEGLAHWAEAVRLSPLDPELWMRRMGQATGECMAGNPEASIKYARQSLMERPGWQARLMIVMSRVMQGDFEQATAECELVVLAKPR